MACTALAAAIYLPTAADLRFAHLSVTVVLGLLAGAAALVFAAGLALRGRWRQEPG